MSTIINRPLTWNGLSAVIDPETGHTIGWTKRKRSHAGRTAHDCFLNTQHTLRDAEYIGTTTTETAAIKKVRWHWATRPETIP